MREGLFDDRTYNSHKARDNYRPMGWGEVAVACDVVTYRRLRDAADRYGYSLDGTGLV